MAVVSHPSNPSTLHSGAVYRETVEMGTIDGPLTLAQALQSLRQDFGPDDYNILNR